METARRQCSALWKDELSSNYSFSVINTTTIWSNKLSVIGGALAAAKWPFIQLVKFKYWSLARKAGDGGGIWGTWQKITGLSLERNCDGLGVSPRKGLTYTPWAVRKHSNLLNRRWVCGIVEEHRSRDWRLQHQFCLVLSCPNERW